MTGTRQGVRPAPVIAAERIRGVSPVLAVPFTEAGDVDHESHARLVEHVLRTGAGSLLVHGLVGESYKLDDSERRRVLSTVLQLARGKDVSVIVSVTDHATELAVRRAQEYMTAGADAINVLPPSFLRPSADQVLAHLTAVLEAVDVPVVYQLAPNETGKSIATHELAALALSHTNLLLVKVETQPPDETMGELLTLSGGRLRLLSGYAGLTWPEAIRAGAVGVQPGCAFVEVYLAAQRDLDASNESGFRIRHARLMPYLRQWMTTVEGLIAVEKTILWRRGLIDSPFCRSPAHRLTPDAFATVDEFLNDFHDDLAGDPG